jgi:hypothetical protein
MSYLVLAAALTLITLAGLAPSTVASLIVSGQHEAWTMPRTGWGDPDLQGVWSFSADTPLNRPAEFEGRALLTDEEVAQRVEATAQLRFNRDNRLSATKAGPSGLEGAGGNDNRFWTDPKRTSRQTSLVVDPPDGRVPPLTPEANRWYTEIDRRRAGTPMDAQTPGGFVQDLGPRGLFTRCILGFNSGPPMAPLSYNENVQIFQTPDHVALLNEMVHSVRVVPLDGHPQLSEKIRQWVGDSRGRWDGDTLVVTTTNFTDQVFDFGRMRPRGSGLILVEQFTRTAADTVLCQFTITDPVWHTSPWTAQLPMEPSSGPLYEYACHEGNHSMPNILAGALE